jgi:hypothetical protein
MEATMKTLRLRNNPPDVMACSIYVASTALRCKSSEQAGTHCYHVVWHLQNWRCLHLNGLPLEPVLKLTLRDP